MRAPPAEAAYGQSAQIGKFAGVGMNRRTACLSGFGGGARELDDKVRRRGPPALLLRAFPAEADEGSLSIAHDDPRVRAADEVTAMRRP